MDEIEYKLNTRRSVLVVNAIDKLISTIKSKYKVSERQKFVIENEELKFLREKCSSADSLVSLTACQGLLALVELGVLEIGHTVSTLVTLLPSAHNYSAIISTMAGLLILDLKCRLVPGQPYQCQFNLRSPKHPFITVLESNKRTLNDVLTQMEALCSHPDYIVSSNSLELLRPVLVYLTCDPRGGSGAAPWRLMLGARAANHRLLLDCISSQQICNPKLLDNAYTAYSTVIDNAIYQNNTEFVVAFIPMLARLSNEYVKNGRDPRSCYSLLERCFASSTSELRPAASLTVMLLADNLTDSSALYLHELFNLCLNIVTKYECTPISLSTFVALSLQWLHLPSYLTSSALKLAAKLLDLYQNNINNDSRLHMPNLKANKTFHHLLYTDQKLFEAFKFLHTWERVRDNPDKLNCWLDSLEAVNKTLQLNLIGFFIGLVMDKRNEDWYEQIELRLLKLLVKLVEFSKDVSVVLLPILIYKMANHTSPKVKMECLTAVPLMAITKENVPTIVSILTSLKAGKGLPFSSLIPLYTSLAEVQVRCFPYLQEVLMDNSTLRADDLRWEIDIAKALAVKKICAIRPSTNGVELVSVISSLLNRCTSLSGAVPCARSLDALCSLWAAGVVAPHSTWAVLQHKLAKDCRKDVHISICNLLSSIPSLYTNSHESLIHSAARQLWLYVAESNHCDVIKAACEALAHYSIHQYTLKEVPEIYRRTVKLPSSYCKTPEDAARKPEDVLDYIPCEIWPEVFKYTNQSALAAVESLVSKLIEKEMKSFRSLVYQQGNTEPQNCDYLQPHSVIRGLVKCLKKQVSSPSYEFPEVVLLSILRVLSAEYSKPPPPLDTCFLHECFHKGELWKKGSMELASRHACTSPSALRMLTNYLNDVVNDYEESDIHLIFELLPSFCRGLPPNTLRHPLEKFLTVGFSEITNIKSKHKDQERQILFTQPDKENENAKELGPTECKNEYLFIKQLKCIKVCLDNERIHEANRKLLSQIMEGYFTEIGYDNVAWPSYVSVCLSLPTATVERITSPSSWWEVSPPLLRAAGEVRGELAGREGKYLNWLNDVVDAVVTEGSSEQEYSLVAMGRALRSVEMEEVETRQWLLQLMARTQVAFKELESESSKLYLCDVFTLAVTSLSGHWCLEPGVGGGYVRVGGLALLPAASGAIVARYSDVAQQMLEWLSHTASGLTSGAVSGACVRAMLASRHAAPFADHRIWTRLETHFGKNTNIDEYRI